MAPAGHAKPHEHTAPLCVGARQAVVGALQVARAFLYSCFQFRDKRTVTFLLRFHLLSCKKSFGHVHGHVKYRMYLAVDIAQRFISEIEIKRLQRTIHHQVGPCLCGSIGFTRSEHIIQQLQKGCPSSSGSARCKGLPMTEASLPHTFSMASLASDTIISRPL